MESWSHGKSRIEGQLGLDVDLKEDCRLRWDLKIEKVRNHLIGRISWTYSELKVKEWWTRVTVCSRQEGNFESVVGARIARTPGENLLCVDLQAAQGRLAQMIDNMRQSQTELNDLLKEYWKLRHATGNSHRWWHVISVKLSLVQKYTWRHSQINLVCRSLAHNYTGLVAWS